MKNEIFDKTVLPFLTDTSWFHIFKELIRSGQWAGMSTAAAKVYPVIKAFINWETGNAFPNLETIEKYSGLSRASVVKALKELEGLGVLRKDHQQGAKGKYTVVERFNVEDADGRPQASVTFDYLPAFVSDTVTQLKHFLVTGKAPEGGVNIIQIETLNLQVNTDQAHGVMETGGSSKPKRLTVKDLKLVDKD